MTRNVKIMIAAVVLVVAFAAAISFSGRGTPELTEQAPSRVEPAVPDTPAAPAPAAPTPEMPAPATPAPTAPPAP